jgi:hypothetical protein
MRVEDASYTLQRDFNDQLAPHVSEWAPLNCALPHPIGLVGFAVTQSKFITLVIRAMHRLPSVSNMSARGSLPNETASLHGFDVHIP